MKDIQVKVEKIYAFKVPDDTDLTDLGSVSNLLIEHIKRQNSTADAELVDSMEVICSKCGISLNTDIEKDEGLCLQCAGGSYGI